MSKFQNAARMKLGLKPSDGIRSTDPKNINDKRGPNMLPRAKTSNQVTTTPTGKISPNTKFHNTRKGGTEDDPKLKGKLSRRATEQLANMGTGNPGDITVGQKKGSKIDAAGWTPRKGPF